MSLANLCRDVKVRQRVEFVLEGDQRYTGYRVPGPGFVVSSFYPAKNPSAVDFEKETLLGYKIKSYSPLSREVKMRDKSSPSQEKDHPIPDRSFVFSDSMSREIEEDREKAERRAEKKKDDEDEPGIFGDEFS